MTSRRLGNILFACWLCFAVILELSLLSIAGCAGSATAGTDVAPKTNISAGDAASITATTNTDVRTRTDHSLDLNRLRLSQDQARYAAMGGACIMLVAIGWSLVLLCMPSPVKGVWRAVLLSAGVAMMASPAILVIALVWR